MADTYVSDTLNSHPSVTRSHRTLPTLDTKTCAHTHTHPRMPYTRIIICVTRHQNSFQYMGLQTASATHAIRTQNRTCPSHTEQNIPFTHTPSHAFCSQTEKSILFTQNKAYCSHTEQGMLFTRKAENALLTQNRECCSYTEQCMLFAHNSVCCSHTEQSKLHTTRRAIRTQQGVLFAHRQSILFTHRTEHIVHIQNGAFCSQKTAHAVHKYAAATCHSHTEQSMLICRAKHGVHTQNRTFCSYTKQSILFTGKIGYSVHIQNRAFCSHAK